MSPRQHERERLVSAARISLSEKVSDWLREETTQELTDAEYISVVTDTLAQSVLGHTKMMIRVERHGNTDTPGGWASVADVLSTGRGETP